MDGYPVEVTNLSPNAAQRKLSELLSSAGKIEPVNVLRSGDYASTANVRFKDFYFSETAGWLPGHNIVYQPCHMKCYKNYDEAANIDSWLVPDQMAEDDNVLMNKVPQKCPIDGCADDGAGPSTQDDNVDPSTQDGKAGPSTQDNNKQKANWNEKLTEMFIDICFDEVKAGNRPKTCFNKLGWANILKKFNEKTGNQYNHKQLKNKWDKLKAGWNIWISLVSKETGFTLNSITNTINALDDAGWKKKLQEIHVATKFRGCGLQHQMKLGKLFINNSVTGEGALAPTLPIHEDVKGIFGADEWLDGENKDHNMIIHGIDDIFIDIDNVNLIPGSYPIQEKEKKRAKVGDDVQLSQEFSHLVDAVDRSTIPSNTTVKSGCSIDEVMKIVRTMPEMTAQPKLLVLAAKVLLKIEYREMFVALQDTHLQIEWLKEMSKQQN